MLITVSAVRPPESFPGLQSHHRADTNIYVGGSRLVSNTGPKKFTRASHSTFQLGTGDFWVAGWVRLDTVGPAYHQGLMSKGRTDWTVNEWGLVFPSSTYYARFFVDNGSGFANAGIVNSASGLIPNGTWAFVIGALDRALGTCGKVYVKVNNNATSNSDCTTAPRTGGTEQVNLGTYFASVADGAIALIATGKPASGTVTGLFETIAARLFNGGTGLRWSEITAEERTAWGLTPGNGTYFHLDESSDTANAVDQVAGLNCTQTGSPGCANPPAVAVAEDSAGTAHATMLGFTGTAQEAAAWSTDVPAALGSGYSMRLDGMANRLVFKQVTLGKVHTLCVWAKASFVTELIFGGSAAQSSYVFHHQAGSLFYNIPGAAAAVALTPDGSAWHHYAVTRNGTALQFYYDGLPLGTPQALGSNPDLLLSCIGSYADSTNYCVTGKLDDVRFYNVAKTAEQIAAIAAGTDDQTGLVNHWRFDDGFQAHPVNGDPVLAWVDRTANRWHFLQPTAAAKPTYYAAAINGKPALYFDGSDDYLFIDGQSLSDSATGTLSLLVKTGPSVFADDHTLLASSSAAGANDFWRMGIGIDGYVFLEANVGGALERVRGSTVLAANTVYLITAQGNGFAWLVRLNKVNETLSVVAGSNSGRWFANVPNRTNFSIGARRHSAGPTVEDYYEGYMAESVLYSTCHGPAIITQLESYFTRRYGL